MGNCETVGDEMNIGLIGCGYWGMKYIRVFQELNHKLSSVYDTNPQALENIKQLFPHLSTASDYKNSDDEVVIIATPASTHYDIAKWCLENDKHILIEKPMALNVRDAIELNELAKQKKKVLMIGHTFLYNPGIMHLDSLVNSNAVGVVKKIVMHRLNDGPVREDVSVIWDLASHDISILLILLNKMPNSISARYENKMIIDLTFDAIKVKVHVSWSHHEKVREIVIQGSKNTLLFDDVQKTVNTPDNSGIIPYSGWQEPLLLQCKDFLDCLKNGNMPLANGDNGVQVVKVLEAIQKALDTGEVVNL